MTYIIHEYDLQEGWEVTKESTNLNDFDKFDRWHFDYILTEGCDHYQEGNRMWTIDKETI